MRTKNNKVALVTGGTGGIGTAICERLYKDGFSVVANYRDFTKAMKWREEAKQWRDDQLKMGIDVKVVEGDISNYKSTSTMIKQITDEIGAIDILVNNAGITRDAPLHKMKPEQWNEVIETNLNSVFNCSRLVIESMIAKNYGRIINISSVNGKKGQFGQTNYASAKAGMYGFTKSLALEVAKKGITVNTISPGYTATSMVMAIKEEIREKIISTIPLGRLGKTDEISAMVSFLASDEAQYITGADMAVNGGLYM
ncbi:MAG: beta-ketoacyl-ACP reductase [Bacteroidetes bacterium RIFCSPLOWO2_12_FULL_35_15]|nr:MAG: beta-ketoacyl-ACP reductase [Bacteroidetes bacterium RIFCSPLOWO2_12_FULL_35_15]